jgi:tetratricopeptide (TPR) repeat protein
VPDHESTKEIIGMKLFIAMLVACPLVAHTLGMTEGIFANQQGAVSQSGSPSEELSKADQLNAEVVKLFAEKEYDKAMVLAQQVLEIREKIFGPDHLMVALSLQNVAELLIAKKKQKEAADVYRRSLTIYEKASGGNDPKLIESLGRYICLLATIGRSDERKDVQKRLFKLENGFDESIGASMQSSKMDERMQGRAVSLPRPDYAVEARASRVSGSVVMKVKVNELGKVIDVKSICGHPLLVKGSEAAIWRARFEPAVVKGQPVQFTSNVIYSFIVQ